MSLPSALKQLRDLDRASPRFHKHLNNFLRSKEYRSAVPSLQGEDVAWLVEYLDSVLMRISDHASSAFQECLHELRSICSTREVLPNSYTLSASLLVNGLPSVPECVHEGTFDGSKVRIQRIRAYPKGDPQKLKKTFHQTAVVWKHLTHPNVVPLLGVNTNPIQLVSGWVSDVDLTGYIANHPDADRLSLLSDVAEGLNYLHSCSVIHEDLKGPNILVDTTGCARITNCGLAMVTQNLDSIRSAPDEHGHSTRWIAPEILDNRGTFSKESDVFSFAMVIIEVFTCATPFNDKQPRAAILATIGGERPPRPIHPTLTDAVWVITQQCWDQEARRRPQVLQILCGLISAWKRSINCHIDINKRISFITAVLSDRRGAEVVKRLCRDDAQAFVDMIDETLDSLGLRLKKKCLSALCKICGRQALLPSSFKIPLCYDRLEDALYSGGYADVWMGEHQGRKVAVKVLRVYSTSDLDKITTRFCKEVVTWKSLRHPNVLPLLGVTMDKKVFAMVSEWMVNGNINEFVKAHWDANRFELLEGVARGLLYMHDEGMIHGDLKGLNILIDQDGHARLADFGLLIIVLDSAYPTSSSSPRSAGTTRWMGPELIDPGRFGLEDGRPTKNSDCYALGMVILEVLSGKPPFPNYNGFTVMRKIVEGERPGRPRGAEEVWFTNDLWEMLEECWSPQPEMRPTIDAVLQCLKQGSAVWQPLPPDLDDCVQSYSDDQSCFTLSHDSTGRIDPQADDRSSVPSQSLPRSMYVGRGSYQLPPGSQQKLTELPVLSDSTNANQVELAHPQDLCNRSEALINASTDYYPTGTSNNIHSDILHQYQQKCAPSLQKSSSMSSDEYEFDIIPPSYPSSNTFSDSFNIPGATTSQHSMLSAEDAHNRPLPDTDTPPVQLPPAMMISEPLRFVIPFEASPAQTNPEPLSPSAGWGFNFQNLPSTHVEEPPTAPVFPTSLSSRSKQGLSNVLWLDPTDLQDIEEFPVDGGRFADVWRGRLEGREVAIKSYRCYATLDNDLVRMRFLREVHAYTLLSHWNIVPFVGVYSTPKHPFSLVFEFMEHFNLCEYFRNKPGAKKLELVTGIARGLHHIHDLGVVHGNLEMTNVLVDSKDTPRIAGLGSVLIHWQSPPVARSEESRVPRSSAPELADPEAFGLPGPQPTKASDIYALGVLAYQVFAGNRVFPNLSDMNAVYVMLDGSRPPRPDNLEPSDRVWDMINRCWEHTPSQRITVEDVVSVLETELQQTR